MKLKKKLELYKNPLISIGIPVFNCEKTIKHVLESLLNQTYKNIEIIISDNCSTDKTKMICKKFKDKRIKFYKQIKPIEFTKNFEFVL